MSTLETVQQAAKDGKLLESAATNIADWLNGGFLPEWASSSIDELVSQEAWEELNDRFYQYMAFGTGGMRGRTIGKTVAKAETGTLSDNGTPAHPCVGSNYLNDFNIIRATVGLFRYCKKYLAEQHSYDVPRFVIAHDVRHFSRHFCELAASTWTRLGGQALIFDGPRSTPQLSYTVRFLKATAGVVITASHNPPHDNGFKAYFADGAQVTPPHDTSIIDEVMNVSLADLAPYLEKNLDGVVTLDSFVDNAYLDCVESTVIDHDLLREQKPKVVFSGIHGTGGIACVPLMERLGLEVYQPEAQVEQDPRFPTVKSPNPENAEALAQAIEKANEVGADVLMATDPDADRMGVAVRNKAGEMVLLTGNMIGSLLAEYRITKLKELGILPQEGTKQAVLIKTFVTTPLQEAIAEGHGLKVIDTLTGFKWIGEKIRHYEEQLKDALLEKQGIALDYDATPYPNRLKLLLEHSTAYIIGGEESYGYLGSDAVRDKDANSAVLMFCELAAYLKKQGMTFPEYLDSIYLKYGYYLEGLVNLYYEGAAGSQKIKAILDSYRAAPPKQIGVHKVTSFTDFGKQEIHDADGKKIPTQNFYFIALDNGYRYAVRGSGTEPKIKFYVFAREDVTSAEALSAAREKAISTLDALKIAIEEDARKRAES